MTAKITVRKQDGSWCYRCPKCGLFGWSRYRWAAAISAAFEHAQQHAADFKVVEPTLKLTAHNSSAVESGVTHV